VSLLTDALRLREERRLPKGGTGPCLPPFRGPNRGYWLGGCLVLILFLLGGFAWWKGTWAIEKLEELAGFPPNLPVKVSEDSKPLDLVKETVPPPVGVEAVKMEGKKEVGATEKPEETKIPAKGENLLPSVSLNPPLVRMGEDKKWDEDLFVKSVEKKGVEKSTTNAVAMDEKKPVFTVDNEQGRKVADVPMGGLRPIKVELDEAGLVLEKPEERERQRVDRVEAFLRSLQVQGVRLQGKDSRILVDGVPIGVGEKVGSMGLVLESVEPQKLIFSDSGGKKYPKSY